MTALDSSQHYIYDLVVALYVLCLDAWFLVTKLI